MGKRNAWRISQRQLRWGLAVNSIKIIIMNHRCHLQLSWFKFHKLVCFKPSKMVFEKSCEDNHNLHLKQHPLTLLHKGWSLSKDHCLWNSYIRNDTCKSISVLRQPTSIIYFNLLASLFTVRLGECCDNENKSEQLIVSNSKKIKLVKLAEGQGLFHRRQIYSSV